jgi:hypothetical protein
MKLYLVTYIDDAPEAAQDDHQSLWCGTQIYANASAKRLKSLGMRNVAVCSTEVPTDKPNLMQFLNDRRVK